jgi:hypothetical protein
VESARHRSLSVALTLRSAKNSVPHVAGDRGELPCVVVRTWLNLAQGAIVRGGATITRSRSETSGALAGRSTASSVVCAPGSARNQSRTNWSAIRALLLSFLLVRPGVAHAQKNPVKSPSFQHQRRSLYGLALALTGCLGHRQNDVLPTAKSHRAPARQGPGFATIRHKNRHNRGPM